MVLSKKDMGEKIKAAREVKAKNISCKYTQQMLADDLGISRGYIGDIENGRTYPNYVLLNKIADACGVPFSFFDDNIIRLGNRFKEIREEKGLSIKEVAQLANIDEELVTRTENGDPVYFDILKKISEAIELNPEEFKCLLSYDWYIRGRNDNYVDDSYEDPFTNPAGITQDELDLIFHFRSLSPLIQKTIKDLIYGIDSDKSKTEQSSTKEVG